MDSTTYTNELVSSVNRVTQNPWTSQYSSSAWSHNNNKTRSLQPFVVTPTTPFLVIPLGKGIHIEGILPKGPYLPCVSMAGRALLAGYPRYVSIWIFVDTCKRKTSPVPRSIWLQQCNKQITHELIISCDIYIGLPLTEQYVCRMFFINHNFTA